jgi:hypothetical protein
MATAAMATSGRELAIGSVLLRAFAAIGAAPVRFFGIAGGLVAVPTIVSRALGAAAASTTVTAYDPYAAASAGIVAGGLLWWVLYMAAQAMLFRATVQVLDGGASDDVRQLATGAARRLLPLLGLAIVLTITVWIGFALLLAPGLIMATMWSVAAPALVVEEVGVFGSMGRSRRLTKGARWRILGLVLLVFAIYFVAASMLGLGTLAMSGFGTARVVAASQGLAATTASLVLTTMFLVVWSAIQATLYVELRDWKDGHSGERLADIFS